MDNNLPNDEGTSLETLTDSQLDYQATQPTGPAQPSLWKPKLPKYTLVIIVIVIVVALIAAGAIILLKRPAAKAPPTQVTINTQSLDNGTLNKLTAQAGPNKTQQQLTITPDTLFKNSVLVQGALKAEKDLDVGGNLNVHGTTTLQGAVGINSNLAVRGALSVGGALSAASLNVGSLAVTTVNASGNLNFGGHLVPTGTTPDVKASVGASGGSATVSGNDTAGTITINIGAGTLIAGEMAIISFHTPFATTPKVQLTPITSSASSLNYYATRSATFFTIDTSSTPTSGASYVFDYLVTQ
jgi:hypothetical protein